MLWAAQKCQGIQVGVWENRKLQSETMNKPLTVVTECVRACVSSEEAELNSGRQAAVRVAPSQALPRPGMELRCLPTVPPLGGRHLSGPVSRFASPLEWECHQGSVPRGPEIAAP